ncbi:MAG: bifunctional UDP-N-acetylglucosamine diphosphorylase/glucosamine-1-phosphate N-acetyltransferase GlmU [Alphaproteobacteria bacterium]
MTSQDTPTTPWLSIILAAGLGTRMKSALPKAAHAIAGRPMLAHVMATSAEAKADSMAVVIGAEMNVLCDITQEANPNAKCFVQNERLGTAHAVLAAKDAIQGAEGHILVLYGDTPLVRTETITRLLAALDGGAAVAVLGFEATDPTGYGRLLRDENGALLAIREENDANEQEKAVRLCNSGVMAFRAETMLKLLERIGNDNAKGEYYLTDVVAIAREQGLRVVVETCDEDEVLGVNDRSQLAEVEAIIQKRLRAAAMKNGTTLIAPETVTFSYDTRLAPDVIVEPNVVFAPGVTVEAGARIHAFSYLEKSHVHAGALIGPFARLRPGADIGEGAKVGNFVEVKKATVEAGAKLNHFTYIGDARVGAKTNIGAGTIVCNYDGFKKHFTDIGAGAFIGSNSALVAPVKIGDGAVVGSGSVITRNVAPDELAIERSEQLHVPGWAARNRKKHGK